PRRASVVDTAMPKQERTDVLTLATIVLDCHCPGAHQITDCLVGLVRHPYRCQLRGPQKTGQRQRISSVGLHALAWSTRDQRRCSHRAARSEEHTSELQSPYDLVCRLL